MVLQRTSDRIRTESSAPPQGPELVEGSEVEGQGGLTFPIVRPHFSVAMYFLYILRTSDNRLYTGITRNLDQRLGTHNKRKGALFTKIHGTGTLVYSEEFRDYASARKREIQLKKWSRAKKEALIIGNIVRLKRLSRAHLP